MGDGGLSRGMHVILWRQGIIVLADIKDEANFTSNQKYGRGNQKVMAELRAVREGVREITGSSCSYTLDTASPTKSNGSFAPKEYHFLDDHGRDGCCGHR